MDQQQDGAGPDEGRPVSSLPVPVYRAPPRPPVVPRPHRNAGAVDAVFILIALGCAGWLAGRFLMASFQLTWTSIIPVLGFYGLVAYLLLPRLHQVFTELYVPNYFIGRTRTADGLLGDPVNLAFDGDEVDVHAAMRAAGWSMADEITIGSSLRMIASTLLRRTYKEAPVSNLMLFGRRQDFAYQQEVGGDASKRHHVRFWKVPDGWLLPGGLKVDWLAAGTYDRSVGLSLFTAQVTHKIDPDIDAERDYIIDTIRYAEPDLPVRTIDKFFTAYHARNGGGDAIHTDGDLPIVDTSAFVEGDSRPDLPALTAVVDVGIEKHHIPPAGLLFAGLISLLRTVQTVTLYPTVLAAVRGASASHELALGIASLVALVPIAYLALWLLTLARRRWARTLFMVLLTADAVFSLLEPVPLGAARLLTLGTAALSVMALLMVSGTAARAWVAEGDARR